MRDLLADVLDVYGAEVVALGRSETFMPVDTEAVSGDIGDRTRAAGYMRTGSTRIVSTDGDGDRPLIVDETGHASSAAMCSAS